MPVGAAGIAVRAFAAQPTETILDDRSVCTRQRVQRLAFFSAAVNGQDIVRPIQSQGSSVSDIACNASAKHRRHRRGRASHGSLTRLSALIAALLLIGAACGGDSTESGPGTTTTSTNTLAPTTTEDAPTTTKALSADSSTTTASPTTTTTSAQTDPTDVEIATINVLHGFPPPVSGCVEHTDNCLAPIRVDILWKYLDQQAGCPEIIALQEISPRWFEIIPEKLPALCGGEHVLLTENVGQIDQEMILTTLPVIDHARVELAGRPIWSAHWAQLDAGNSLIVDVFATHYASSAFNPPCDDSHPATSCPSYCPADGDLGSCHPFQTLDFLTNRAAENSLRVIVGDLNKQISDPRIQTLLDGGFIDTHLAANNAECPPTGGANCTAGIGGPGDLHGLDIAEQTLRSRIDFILAAPPPGCELLVDVGDADEDSTHTGLWADKPLDEPVEGLYWASDHTGVQADIGLDCR